MQLPPRSPYSHLLRINPFNAALLAAIVFACIAVSDPGAGAQMSLHNGGPRPKVSSDPQQIEARSPMPREHAPGINLNAFNQERTKAIAKDSEKLLVLAEALKSELDRDPNRLQSDDVIRKIKEIEKLAHKVKQRMLADPTASPLLR